MAQGICRNVGPRLPRELPFCAHTILSDEPLIVSDLRDDSRFADNPLVSGPSHLRFYAGVPLRGADGSNVGTLCAMDLEPRELSPDQLSVLSDLAQIAMDALRLRLVTLANQQLSVAVSNVSVGVLVTDSKKPDNPITFANPAFAEITGYAPEDFIGRNCRFLQGPGTDPGVVNEIRRAIREARTFRGVLRNYRRDGSTFWNELTITPVLDEEGRVRNFIAFQNDVSERKQAQDALQESYDQLRILEGQRDNLTGMIVHDMRSPLSVAMAFLDLVRSEPDGRLDPEDREAIQYASDAVQELNGMITSLLDVSRLESGQMPLDIREHDLAELVRDTLASRIALDGTSRLILAPPTTPMLVRCDADLTARVINNLVGNAIKFTPSPGTVRVTLARDGTRTRCSVIDTGAGVSPEHHAMIFEKFGQVDKTRQAHSTGLGLAFCKLAIEAQGGAIGLESEAGVGSTFWFMLP